MTTDYYQLLHVLPDAPSPVIKASYRAMMQKMRHHPDLGGDLSRAQLLNEAVDTLCNPARRAIYDKELQAIASRLNRDAAAPADGTEKPSPQARNKGSGAEENSDMPGGKPNGYEKRTERPDETANREPESAHQQFRKHNCPGLLTACSAKPAFPQRLGHATIIRRTINVISAKRRQRLLSS